MGSSPTFPTYTLSSAIKYMRYKTKKNQDKQNIEKKLLTSTGLELLKLFCKKYRYNVVCSDDIKITINDLLKTIKFEVDK